MSSVFSMYGKMQESGLTEIIPLTGTSEIWGQDPVLCQAGWCTTGEAAVAPHPPCADTEGNHFSSTGSSWHPVSGGQGCCPTSGTTEVSPKKRIIWLKASSAVEKPRLFLPDRLSMTAGILFTCSSVLGLPPHQGVSMCAQANLTLCNPTVHEVMDPITSVHGILQVRILEWVAMLSSRESYQPRDRTPISCIGRRILYHRATWKAPLPPR